MKSQKVVHLLIFLLCTSFISKELISASAITYTCESGDRFGDQLCCYCHARWVSHVLNMPFLFRPFKYSDQLALHSMHPWFTGKTNRATKIKVLPKKGGKVSVHNLGINPHSNTIYQLPFFPESRYDAIKFGYRHFDVNWNDEQFISLLRNEIKPRRSLPAINLPSDKVTVALHFRKGSGPDQITTRKVFYTSDYPLRFAPESFYSEQLKKLSEMLNDAPMYVYVFTDAKNPLALIESLKKAVNRPNITFARKTSSYLNPEQAVIEDFFNMARFQCIIRSESHYSIISSKIGLCKIEIYPQAFTWRGRELVITKTETVIKDQDFVEKVRNQAYFK